MQYLITYCSAHYLYYAHGSVGVMWWYDPELKVHVIYKGL